MDFRLIPFVVELHVALFCVFRFHKCGVAECKAGPNAYLCCMGSVSRKGRLTFGKSERLRGRKAVDELFTGKREALTAYPLRFVAMRCEPSPGAAPVRVVVVVSKRKFKRAVDRNRAKRLMREAYRRHKHILFEGLQESGTGLSVAIVWLAGEFFPFDAVSRSMARGLEKIRSRLC